MSRLVFSRLFAVVAILSSCSRHAVCAEINTPPVFGTDRITSPEGLQRVLVAITFPEVLDRIALGDAKLIGSLPGFQLDRDLDLSLGAISTPWTIGAVDWTTGWRKPGGDIDPDLRSRLTIGRGQDASEITVDVSNIVRAISQEKSCYGLMISVPDGKGDGLDVDTAELLASAFSHAQLRIEGRAIPGERSLPGIPVDNPEEEE